MRKSLASGVGVAAALMVVFGSGSTGAVNEYVGQTYAKAAQAIKSSGGTAVISSREGSYLPTEKCIVVGSRKAGFLDSSGRSQSGKVLLDLNCNDTYAGNSGHPGNSAVTPDGQKVQQTRKTAQSLNEDYATATAQGSQSYCQQNAAECKSFCQGQGAGLCSAELTEFLGL